MNYKEYLSECFRNDLQKLNYGIRQKIFGNMVFFGGDNWSNMDNDLRNIDKENRDYFCLSLFTIITFDQCAYTYYKEYYEIFREKTMYPKFGWSSGMGYLNEQPKKLLNLPEKNGYISGEKILNIIDEYINLFIDECNEFFKIIKVNIDSNDFLIKLINDYGFMPKIDDANTIYSEIYKRLKNKIEKCPNFA
jgi:hypothetical protein